MSMNAVPTVAGGGEPPYDNNMDRRLTVLETRFDTILPTLSTKADLEALRSDSRIDMEKLRVEVGKAINDTMKWMIGLVLTLFIGTIGVNVALFNALRTVIVSSQPVAASAPLTPPPAAPTA